MNTDIRWKQRFNNYNKALAKLSAAVQVYTETGMSDIEKEGMIQRFEYTYELVWLTIKDFFEGQGDENIYGSKAAFRLAYSRGLIQNGDAWMNMIESRQRTVHTYDEDTANDVADKIAKNYLHLFQFLEKKLREESEK